MRLKNIHPSGAVTVSAIGRDVGAGEEFDVDDEVGAALLEQAGNYEQVPTTKKKEG